MVTPGGTGSYRSAILLGAAAWCGVLGVGCLALSLLGFNLGLLLGGGLAILGVGLAWAGDQETLPPLLRGLRALGLGLTGLCGLFLLVKPFLGNLTRLAFLPVPCGLAYLVFTQVLQKSAWVKSPLPTRRWLRMLLSGGFALGTLAGLIVWAVLGVFFLVLLLAASKGR